MKSLTRLLASAGGAVIFLSALTPSQAVYAATVLERALTSDGPAQLEVTVSNIASQDGAVWIGLYADERAFDDGVEVASIMLDADPSGVRHIFTDLAAGEYAIVTFHDANGDRDFTRNFMGIPQERYGFSNNPRPRFRGANWDEARFEVTETGTRLEIALHGVGG